MLTVEDDWIQYEALPARRAAVRGGAACAQRIPVLRERPVLRAVPSPPAARSRLRLTRRGRIVLVVAPALAALSAVLVATGTPSAQAAPEQRPAVAVVRSGDSLWSVAERTAPDLDPRVVVAAIERANGLRGAQVAAGTVLRLPEAVAGR